MDELQMPALDPALLARAGARLEGFAAGLSRHGQAALQVLLTRAASADGQEIAPPAGLLEPQELAVYEQLRAEPPSAVDGGRAVLTVIMKATRLCNLRCTYCHSWKEGPGQVMGFPVLARAIRDVLGDPGVHYVDFVWHGGEATLLSPAFYSKALWLQERFRRSDQVVHNTIQTNGTHLTDAWLSFLRDHQIRVGVSLDGPPEIHDRRRLDAAGRPTAARVREGLRRLHAAGIPQVGILMVVDEEVCDLGAGPLLAYLLETGIKRVALLNVLPENSGTAIRPGSYLPLPRFVEFLCELFRVWWPHRDRLAIRELSDLITKLRGGPPGLCVFAGDCFGGFLTVEPTGEVSACDKYIGDEQYRFGNVLVTSLAKLQRSAALLAVRERNAAAVRRMRACPWFFICQGGCPHDRYTGERLLPGFDGRCCGFAPLLNDLAEALGDVKGEEGHD